jgi:polyhydroxybutyrate depolymerase
MTSASNRLLRRARQCPGLRIWPWAVTLAVGLLGVAGAAPPPAKPSITLEERTLVVDGVERNYLLHAPPNAAALEGKRPLVLSIHGGGGTAKYAARETGPSLAALADEHGFYLAFPNAIGGMWDFGLGRVSASLPQRTDDRAFFAALLDTLIDEAPIDERRIFATGISRGGIASYFVACSLPGRIRAIAPVAMSLPIFLEDPCASAPPTGVAIMNGTDDPLVPYMGGWITVNGQKRDEILSTDTTVAFWRARNGCTGEPVVETIDPVADDITIEKSSWRSCTGAPVLLYRIIGGGHTWPNGLQYLPPATVGKVSHDIDGGAEAWAFFSEFK